MTYCLLIILRLWEDKPEIGQNNAGCQCNLRKHIYSQPWETSEQLYDSKRLCKSADQNKPPTSPICVVTALILVAYK